MTRRVRPVRLTSALLLAALVAGPVLAAAPASRAETPARSALALTPAEAEEFRAGMRRYLESVEGIVSAVSSNAMPRVSESARRSGMAMLSEVPLMTALKFPPEFVVMATDTHQKFDELAEAAQSAGTKIVVLQHLSTLLANCTSCHAMYRVAP